MASAGVFAGVFATMAWLFASGHAVDVVLIVIGIEWGWLVLRARWTMVRAGLCLGPGALMLLSLRAALTGLDWRWIALLLLASFPLNLADLALRTRDKPGPQ